MYKILLMILAITLQGCVIFTTNYIRNETDGDLKVSVQGEKQDLGWKREERESLTIKKHTICRLDTDVYFDTYFYISDPKTGSNTNLNALENDNYIYTVNIHGKKQVVTVTEADRKTKSSLYGNVNRCIGITNEG